MFSTISKPYPLLEDPNFISPVIGDFGRKTTPPEGFEFPEGLSETENNAPIVQSGFFTTTEDSGTVTVDLLSNTFDPENDEMRAEVVFLNVLEGEGQPVASLDVDIDEDASTLTFDTNQFNDLENGQVANIGIEVVVSDEVGNDEVNNFLVTVEGRDEVAPQEADEADGLIIATEAKEPLRGTEGDNIFLFEEGTSTKSALDTILNWQPGDIIDLSAFGFSAGDLEQRFVGGDTVLKLIEGFGEDDFQLKIDLGDNSVADILSSIILGEENIPLEIEDNTITATEDAQPLRGTGKADTFVVEEGSSTQASLDTIQNWRPDDIIDLSETGLQLEDLEQRFVGGGSILKLIEGFEPDDFQLKIDLGNNAVEDVLASIIFADEPEDTFIDTSSGLA